MSKIMIGNILVCPSNNKLFMRTIIVNGKPMTTYSECRKDLE